MDEDMFLSIACQEVTMQQAYWFGYIKVEGENFLRDFLIFDKMFDEYPQIIEIMNPLKPELKAAS